MKHELANLPRSKDSGCYVKDPIFNGRIQIDFIVNNVGLD